MKLSRLYSNQPQRFAPISFNDGFNVVLAEIRLPENRSQDTHNLGKTTLGRLLDFCFLADRDKNFFLFKHSSLFKDFVFFLELHLADGSYVTVRRSVEEASKIAFRKHDTGGQDLTSLHDAGWDHLSIPIEKAKSLLDGLLDWRAIRPWAYRKVLGYLLRTQDDYREVFQLKKFVGKHSDWKPLLAHLLGFDSSLATQHYNKERELAEKNATLQTVREEFGGVLTDDAGKVDGILLLKREEVERKQKLLDDFDFRLQDAAQSKALVDEVDSEISSLNARRYSLAQNKKKVVSSLSEDQILFDPTSAQKLFNEAGVLFEGQIKKDFQQLIDFNRAITEERRGYLREELAEIDSELTQINFALDGLGRRRSQMLSFLSGSDSFVKYKRTSDELVTLRADITSLERQRSANQRLQELRSQIRSLIEECGQARNRLEQDVVSTSSDAGSLFSSIRLFFSEIIEGVLDRKALLSVSINQQGHLEFRADILDDSGNTTSADLGHTYRKLLCIAFDFAVLRAHMDKRFPQFVYHDGVFESLDDRKKENLLVVLRRYSDLGIQSIITVIDF